MNILIVGNILKDVYLNLDSRTEAFEQDKHHVNWLNLSFNASEHHYFNRHSSFGGAAITLQVLEKLGLTATVTGSDFRYIEHDAADAHDMNTARSHRYILISDDGVSYITPSNFEPTVFIAPTTEPDYIYLDRSAFINEENAQQISSYLDAHPHTNLIVYQKDDTNSHLNQLANRATLIFTEKTTTDMSSFDKTIFLSEHDISYKNITEPITIERIDKLTHLSAYSIASATVLGSFLLGLTVENSLKMARANIESANLDSVLTLDELNAIVASPSESLDLIAASLVAPHKGILAADESGGSINKKFAELNIEDTFEHRHDYRNIFFSTPDIENYTSGIILFDETARDFADNGQHIPDYLISRRIIPGIKVDQGLEPLPDHTEETYTKGLADLPQRLREYYGMGLRFAKWRAAFNLTLDDHGNILTPTDHAITENCRILAEYARDCQSAGLVPIVEPELVYDGNYSLTQSVEVTGHILSILFKTLESFGVNLRACILKCNMVLAGKRYHTQSTPEEVGKATAEVLKNHVPSELAGIVFLSGGQTPEQATDNLASVIKNGPFPWPVTFSFARALQDPALYAWKGDHANAEAAKEAFLARLKANSEALNS